MYIIERSRHLDNFTHVQFTEVDLVCGLWAAENIYERKFFFFKILDLLVGDRSLQKGTRLSPMQRIEIGAASSHKPEDASQWHQRFQSWSDRPSHTRTSEPPKTA